LHLKKQKPKIGILNVGEEEGKGNKLTKEAYQLLLKAKAKGLNFIGNAEGRDVYSGRFDVIVCDGFVGNIVLKLSESLAKILAKVLKEEIQRHFISRIGPEIKFPDSGFGLSRTIKSIFISAAFSIQ
jgi:glycerol-3-phosphate acyltransferase PlsX